MIMRYGHPENARPVSTIASYRDGSDENNELLQITDNQYRDTNNPICYKYLYQATGFNFKVFINGIYT